MGEGDALLIGVDLVKPAERILAAYNDAQGVTAAFNMNLLQRIQNTYQTDLDLDTFCHRAIYNVERSRIEMHLISTVQQDIQIEGRRFATRLSGWNDRDLAKEAGSGGRLRARTQLNYYAYYEVVLFMLGECILL